MPLNNDLRAIAEGEASLPTTSARRHHFVPAFHLARFAEPAGDRKARLYQLDTRTGTPQRTNPDSACFVRDLYARDGDEGRDNTIEALMSIFERHAAPAMTRLVKDPLALDADDREALCWHFAFQYLRTPVALSQIEGLSQVLLEATLAVKFSDPVGFRNVYREALGDEASDEEIERTRISIMRHLQDGAVSHSKPRLEALRVMLDCAGAVAEIVNEMQWQVLEAADAEFVISDRAIAMQDHALKYPWQGHAWRSSPHAQTIIPLDPEHCLLVQDGPPRIGRARVAPGDVMRINLAIYGWAERFIYARTQDVVQVVRSQAKRRRELVIRPRVTKQVLFEPADPGDPAAGADKVKLGLPRGAWVPRPDGGRQFCTYTVLDPDDPRGTSATAGVTIGTRVVEIGRRAAASGAAASADPEIRFAES